MGLKFSHAVGYRGVCALGDTINDSSSSSSSKAEESSSGVAGQLAGMTTVLCTGGNINLTQDPIMGSGVWGAGYENAAPIAYAWNYLNLQGSVNFELTTSTGGGTSVWQRLKQGAFTSRTSAQEIMLLPDGKNGFHGPGWISSLSFDASEGQAISGSFNFKGDPSGNNITSTGEGDTSKFGAGTPEGLAGATLIPYWKTSVIANSATLKDIISWSCSYNSDIQMLKCCNKESTAPLSADYILLGEMSGDGNYTIFRLAGDFTPSNYHVQKSNLTFNVGENKIIIPKAIINSGSTSMATGASYITAEYSFTALGDGKSSIMTMS